MKYVVTEIKGVYDSKYPDSKRYQFRVEGYDNELSTFSKFPMKEGDEINGEITVNGQYHNFKFGAKATSGAPAADLNRVEMKLDAILAGQQTLGGQITAIKSVLGDILSKVDKVDTSSPF